VYSRLLLRIDQIKISQICLGEGNGGKVFLGHIASSTALSNAKSSDECAEGIRVAVKVLGHVIQNGGPSTDESTSRLRSALLEARLHARLSHPNVVQLLGVQEARQPVMLALEYCEHGSLRDLLRTTAGQRRFNLIQRQDMAAQVAAGLRYLHSRLCVHRDVAARNVLVASGGVSCPPCGYTVKLGDLGLARQLRPESDYYTVRISIIGDGAQLYRHSQLLSFNIFFCCSTLFPPFPSRVEMTPYLYAGSVRRL
jgi:serine/threonine protein kinase